MKKALWIISGVMAVGAMGFVAASMLPWQNARQSLLRARRVAPSAEGTVSAPSGGIVEFVYEVSNLSSRETFRLEAKLGCRCHESIPLPEELAPGETARFGFRMGVGEYGSRSWSVPIARRGSGEVLLVLEAAVVPDISPPAWVRRPGELYLNFVAGSDQGQSCLWESVEPADSEPWLADVATDVERLRTSLDVSTEALEDPHVVKRQYRLTVRPGDGLAGADRGVIVLRFRDSSEETNVVRCNLTPRFSLHPATVAIVNRETVAELRVLDRVGRPGRAEVVVDHPVLTVQPIGESEGIPQKLQLKAGDISLPAHVTVTLRVDGVDAARALVTIGPE